jgi:hypothetical protein
MSENISNINEFIPDYYKTQPPPTTTRDSSTPIRVKSSIGTKEVNQFESIDLQGKQTVPLQTDIENPIKNNIDSKFEPKQTKSHSDENKQEEKEEEDEEETSIKSKLKHVLQEWLNDTTTHGFSNILKSKTWFGRIIWTTILASSSCYCFYSKFLFCFLVDYKYFIYLNFYYSAIIVTLIQFFKWGYFISYSSYLESPTNFPAVTICNMNPFDISMSDFAGNFLNNVIKDNHINPTIDMKDFPSDDGVLPITQVEKIQTLLLATLIANPGNYTNDELQTIGFTMERMLISCYFNGIECKASDFDWLLTFEYGNCWTFNSLRYNLTKPRKTSKSGAKNGLVMELFIGEEGYF